MSKANTASLCMAAAMCAGVGSVHAQYSVNISTEVEQIENPLLSPVNPGGVTVVRLVPTYTYEAQGDRTRSRFTAGAVIERSSNTQRLASRNYPSLGYTWGYTWPTADIELRGNLAESATRNTELQDLGRVTVDGKERTAVLGATWNKDLTARTRLTLGAENNRVTYDTPLLVDYREQEVFSRFSWEATERTTYYVEPAFSRLLPAGGIPDSRLNRWLVGSRAQLAPDLSLTASLGHARATGFMPSSATVGGVQLTHTGTRLTTEFELQRGMEPLSSTSGYVRAEVLRVRLGYQLSESATISASYRRSESIGPAGATGTVLGLTLNNELASNWSSLLGVEDRKSNYVVGGTGTGWSVRAALIYLFPGR